MPENWLIFSGTRNLVARLTWQEHLGVYELRTEQGEDLGHYSLHAVCSNVAAHRWTPLP